MFNKFLGALAANLGAGSSDGGLSSMVEAPLFWFAHVEIANGDTRAVWERRMRVNL